MNTPIVFSFNDSYTIPAGVCITSLLKNAKPDLIFNINILYSSDRLSVDNINKIKQLEGIFKNCTITFIDVNSAFKNEYEVRNVSIESYYRLLIPTLFKQHNTVLYSDVDIIYNKDISTLLNIEMDNHAIAGVKEYPNKCNASLSKYFKKLDLNPSTYVNAGILLFNNKKINSTNIYQQKLKQLLGKKFKYQDQDILNITFKDDIKYIDGSYNYNIDSILQDIHILNPHIIHYTLNKPWNKPKLFGDTWWTYYKNSIFYNEATYFSYLKQNYEHFEILINLDSKLKKSKFYNLYYFIRRIFNK